MPGSIEASICAEHEVGGEDLAVRANWVRSAT
jgi:hypothetical protein